MSPLSPLLASNNPVNWWFAFKFNGATFPGDATKEPNPGIFGGAPINYDEGFSLDYAYASSANPSLVMGPGYIGTSVNDPLGATFSQIYNGVYSYVLWNDEFANDPMPDLDSPWGHSKGLLAWDSSGAGLVLQVSTPSWPASGSAKFPRKTDGNTLGCVRDDDVMVSQHFFALQVNAADVAIVLAGLGNASVVTDASNAQICNPGGPANLVALANKLGVQSDSTVATKQTLSSGVVFLSKPSLLHVPPWQLVSAQLGGLPIRAATWWADPTIPSTSATTPVTCWEPGLGQPGAVQIAISGRWQNKTIGLTGGEANSFNHAKIGVSMLQGQPWCIFGDLNQQGTLSSAGDPAGCASAQNGRGGTFYVLNEPTLFKGLTSLLQGSSAPVK
ncbi:MAG TPA: deoxyribonuclease II family protein [Candidatus Acidoferrales bacterium]|nr:deoxyribonuclease II family protein [Candidatus Acidoferrales bacterium]